MVQQQQCQSIPDSVILSGELAEQRKISIWIKNKFSFIRPKSPLGYDAGACYLISFPIEQKVVSFLLQSRCCFFVEQKLVGLCVCLSLLSRSKCLDRHVRPLAGRDSDKGGQQKRRYRAAEWRSDERWYLLKRSSLLRICQQTHDK